MGMTALNSNNILPPGSSTIESLQTTLSPCEKRWPKYPEGRMPSWNQRKWRQIGRIAAHIAHEIRNPLVTMGGMRAALFSSPGMYHAMWGKWVKNIKKAGTINFKGI
jgi:hypothetical protein